MPMEGQYVDFELSIGEARGDGNYEISSRSMGDASETVTFKFDPSELEHTVSTAHAMWRGSGSATATAPLIANEVGGHARVTRDAELVIDQVDAEAGLRDFGTQLFNAVIVGSIARKYQSHYEDARRKKLGLRVRLRIQVPEVAALPWEYLYDPEREIFLARTSQTSIVRYLPLEEPPEPLSVTFPLRVLGVVASPVGPPALQKDREKERMNNALGDLIQLGQVNLTWAEHGTYDALADALEKLKPHVVHFIGHGTLGAILLENEDRTPNAVSADQLGELLLGHRDMRLMVLNSCEGARGSGRGLFSSTAATIARRGVPAVVAMQYPITDDAAVKFAHELYEGLAKSQPVDRAVSAARMSLGRKSPEWGTPVVFLQSPTGQLFDTGLHATPPLGIQALDAGFLQRVRDAIRKLGYQVGSAAACSIALFAFLQTKAPHMGITADVVTRIAEFRMDARAALDTVIPAASLLASGFDEVNFLSDSLPLSSKVVQLEAMPGDTAGPAAPGRIDLLLNDAPFPDSTLVTLSAAGPEYTLSLPGNVPDIGLTLVGKVRRAVRGSRSEITDYGPLGTRATLVSTGAGDSIPKGKITFSLPAGTDSVAIPNAFPVRSLRLFGRVEGFGEGDSPQLAKGLVSGGVTDQHGRELLQISASEHGDLRMKVDSGRVERMVLGNGAVRLVFRGSVNRLGDGVSYSPSQMLTRFGVLSLPMRFLFLAGAALVGVLVAEGIMRIRRRKATT